MAQTTVQKQAAIRFGSAKLEVGSAVESLVDLGSMKGIKFAEKWDEVNVESDNAGEIFFGIKNQICTVTGSLYEIDMTNLAALRGGIDILTPVAGVKVEAAVMNIEDGWVLNKFIKIENQNGNKSAIVIVSVIQDPLNAETPLVLDTDYVVSTDDFGNYGIVILDTVLTDVTEDIAITYDYTPNAAVSFSSGGKFTIASKVMRLTNVNEAGKKFEMTIYKASNAKGLELEFKADGEILESSIEIRGRRDVTRDEGDQLFSIVDEQSPA